MMSRQAAVQLAYRGAVALMAAQGNLDPAEVLTANSQGGKCLASTVRQRALYLIVTGFDVPLSQAALAAGISKQAVSKALRRIEDQRDDPEVDQMLDRLQNWLTGGVSA